MSNTSLVEWGAVVCSVAYVVLVAKRHILCWLFAAIASALYIYLCYIGDLYIEAMLNVFYLMMAFIGWLNWNSSSLSSDTIFQWKWNWHVLNILLSGGIAFMLGYLFDVYTNQANPYIDAFTTCFSLAATFMVARKILENWIYWIVIDAVSIYLYADRGFYLSAVLFFSYTILATIGFIVWRKKFQLQNS